MGPASPISTARFMAVWAAWQAVLMAVVWGPTYAFYIPISSAVGFRWGFTLLLALVMGLLQGFVGARLLSRYRRRVPGWVRAVVFGSLAGSALAQTTTDQAVRILGPQLGGGSATSQALGWGLTVIWVATGALVFALTEALALWGRRWPRAALVWFPGKLAVGLVACAVGAAWETISPAQFLMEGADPAFGLRMAGLGLCVGVIEGAGTAWLLDRCAFRAAPAGSAGA